MLLGIKHRSWVAFSGFVWFAVGVSLLYKGLQLVTQAVNEPGSFCRKFNDAQQCATILIAVGLLLGFVKGRLILSKTVKRVVSRIASLPLPIRMGQVYSKSYWFLIGGMVLLGMSFKYLPIPIDIRGAVDVAIGSALINGAMLYFRAAKAVAV